MYHSFLQMHLLLFRETPQTNHIQIQPPFLQICDTNRVFRRLIQNNMITPSYNDNESFFLKPALKNNVQYYQLYSTSFYNWYVGAAQIYQNRSYGTRYPVRGSYCNRGFECGTFYVELSVGISYSSWAIGAVLRSKSKWSRISISWRWI